MEFRFETKIACFVIICTFAHHTFSQHTMTPNFLWKGPHIPISSVICVISMMLMTVFNSSYFSVNISVIPIHFYYFIFCFKFYYPIVDTSPATLYLLFLCLRKANGKYCNRKEKNLTAISFWSS